MSTIDVYVEDDRIVIRDRELHRRLTAHEAQRLCNDLQDAVDELNGQAQP